MGLGSYAYHHTVDRPWENQCPKNAPKKVVKNMVIKNRFIGGRTRVLNILLYPVNLPDI